ncbi:DNA primase [Puniceicoccus vermicola]|uniref:DNA primase n=1 Tax=Puniceicoccus vermicola TaxID=388746 RepID=A0A7X1AXN2_9BACT|nr:DNA primase [Puniceicoccus vermicola]MBC2600705.1 DNA primase [Puniceicoccus vermicola]
MPVISRQTIDEVRRRANIVEIAGKYTALKRAGREYRGLSPFTEEKTPSFFVNPEKNVFSCFSTQEAGDVFGFVQKLEHLSFQEAVEHLADRVGVQVEYEKGGPSRQEISLRKQLFEVNAQAAAFFAGQFQKEDEAGAKIRDYWTNGRGFQMETAKDVGIGFAPVDPTLLVDFLRKKGFEEKVLDASGLFYERRSGRSGFFPRFRGRLMIPIRDVQERTIAFTARVTPLTPEDDKTKDAKYVNSPETPLFQKRRVVFGLDRAGSVVRGGGRFLLVEGQLDVIRCWESGIPEAIALQGTAAGEEQFLLLKRYCNGVDVLLDGDRAGKGAAFKLLPIGFQTGVDLRFAPLPEGTDPDDLLREKGAAAVEEIRKNAGSPIHFALRYMAPEPLALDVASRSAVFEELYGLLRQLESDVTRKDFFDEAARYFRSDTQAVINDYTRFLKKGHPSGQRPQEAAAPPSDLRLTENEEVLLFLALQFPKIREIFSQTSICEWITEESPEARLLRRLGSELIEGSFTTVEDFRDECETDQERSILARLVVREVDLEDPEQTAERVFHELVRKFASKEITRLVDTMNALPAGDPELRSLQARRRELRNLIHQPPVLANIA